MDRQLITKGHQSKPAAEKVSKIKLTFNIRINKFSQKNMELRMKFKIKISLL